MRPVRDNILASELLVIVGLLLRAGCIAQGWGQESLAQGRVYLHRAGSGRVFPSLAMRFSKVESVIDRGDLNTTVTHFFT